MALTDYEPTGYSTSTLEWYKAGPTIDEATSFARAYSLTPSYIIERPNTESIPTSIINSTWVVNYKITNGVYERWWADDTYNTNATTNTIPYYRFDKDGWIKPPAPTPAERLKDIIQSRQAPTILGARRALTLPSDIRETRARETLQRVIGVQKFRNFLKHGFITVRGSSGKVYQIFPAHGMTCVYDKGVMVERLCVVLRGDFPPTDSLIMRYLLILNNEDEFRKYAIVHNAYRHSVQLQTPVDHRSLVDIFAELKVA